MTRNLRTLGLALLALVLTAQVPSVGHVSSENEALVGTIARPIWNTNCPDRLAGDLLVDSESANDDEEGCCVISIKGQSQECQYKTRRACTMAASAVGGTSSWHAGACTESDCPNP